MGRHSMAGILHVVATPIGNLGDLGERARDVLAAVDLIACEDTRHTRKLLTRFGISTPTTSYHQHNEEGKARQLLERLQKGDSLALVSDAGTPLLSDPGYLLVRLCRQTGVAVRAVPGPSAITAALSVAGMATDRFCFAGFPPRSSAALTRYLQTLAALQMSLVFFLSPHRLRTTLGAMLKTLGNRQAFLTREMTKIHEEDLSGSLEEILEGLGKRASRGEYTLVVEGEKKSGPPLEIDVPAYLEGLMRCRKLGRKDAIRRAARELGIPGRELYRRLLQKGE